MPADPHLRQYDFVADLLRDRSESVADKRRFKRRAIHTEVQLIPLTDHGLRYDQALSAEAQDISPGGIALVVSKAMMEPRWAVRLDLGTRTVLLEIDIRFVQETADGRFRICCKFVGRLDSSAPGPSGDVAGPGP